MSGPRTDPAPPPGAALLARVALAAYPPAWRARYGAEVLALLAESGAGPAASAKLAWHAIPAWIWPPRHLHDRPARMRASLAMTLLTGAMLTGLGLVFAQLTQLQRYRPPGHPVVGRSYLIFDTALAVSALIAAGGGLPLWLVLVRQAYRERRARDVILLLLPAIAPAAYLVVLAVTVALVQHAHGVSPGWFLAYVLLGFAAAGLAAGGPGLVLLRLRPRGPAVRLAATAAGLAVGTLVFASVASGIAAIGLARWDQDFAGYHDGPMVGTYLVLVTVTGLVAVVSAARGLRAALAA